MERRKAIELLSYERQVYMTPGTADYLHALDMAIQALQLLDKSITYIDHRHRAHARVTISKHQLTAYPILFNQHVLPLPANMIPSGLPQSKSLEQQASPPG